MTTSTKEHTMGIERIVVVSKMSKRDVASLIRDLTNGLAETQSDRVDIQINLSNEFGGARSLISVGDSTIFGNFGVITDSHIIEKDGE